MTGIVSSVPFNAGSRPIVPAGKSPGRSAPSRRASPSWQERVAAFHRHIELILSHSSEKRRYAELRKACAWYSKGLHAGSGLRQAAGETKDPDEIIRLGRDFFNPDRDLGAPRIGRPAMLAPFAAAAAAS